MSRRTVLVGVSAALAALLAGAPARAQDRGGPTPPRLAFIDGEVSFWRPGAADWAPAQVNTALAEGDQIYAADGANVELQLGTRAFVRAGSDTQLGLEALDDRTMQFQVSGGHAVFDLARLPAGSTIEIDTPRAAYTIERPGYFRVDVDDQRTSFVARRGGVARVTSGSGDETDVGSDQSLVLADDHPGFAVQPAGPEDDWDRWNVQRTASFGAAPRSAPYVPQGVAGVDDLDRYGDWQNEPQYGQVWRPRDVPPDWSPYSTGRWVYDPYYDWTWVDDSPWGWAPYHYGRWVYTSGFWGWAPGPVVVAAPPVYAPALVAFFGGVGVGVSVGVGLPFVSWCPLGFGEPVIPWWGGAAFVGHPWWGGWGGPRIVNNVVINNTRIVNVNNITHYQNVGVRNAVVGIDHDRFGRGARPVRIANHDNLRPLHGQLGVRPAAQSFVPHEGRGRRPPAQLEHRQIVTTRRAPDPMQRLRAKGIETAAAPMPQRETRLVHPRGGAEHRVAQQPAAGASPTTSGFQQRGQPARPGGARGNAAVGRTTPPPPPRGQHQLGGAPVPPHGAGRAGVAPPRNQGRVGSAPPRNEGRVGAATPPPRHAPTHSGHAGVATPSAPPPPNARRNEAEPRARAVPPPATSGLHHPAPGVGAPPSHAGAPRPPAERHVDRDLPHAAPQASRPHAPSQHERMNVPREAAPVPVPDGNRTRLEAPRAAPADRSARREPAPSLSHREAPRTQHAPAARPTSPPREQAHGHQGHAGREG